MKILIYTNHSHNNADVSGLTYQNHFEYALRHGYDIMWEHCSYSDLLDKMPKIIDLLKMYDAIFMLDADTFITNPKVTLEGFVAQGKDVIMCEEYLGPHTRLNMGVMLLKNTPNTNTFLWDIHRTKPEWIEYEHLWQTWVNQNLEQLPITLLPGRAFNSIVYGDRTYWQKGDFIAHFAGNENRFEIMKEFKRREKI